ncbi:MAG: RDD family protein [Pseudonocardiaceae bacterium]
MSRWTQTWLSGPGKHPGEHSAAGSPGERDTGERDYAGQRLGLPEHGPGAAGGFGARILAITIDWLPCSVAAQLLTKNPAFSALALFAAVTALSLGIAGRTAGHAVAGLRVALLDGSRAGFGAAVIRTVLLCLLIPPVVYDTDGRGLHDRAVGTIVLRTR